MIISFIRRRLFLDYIQRRRGDILIFTAGFTLAFLALPFFFPFCTGWGRERDNPTLDARAAAAPGVGAYCCGMGADAPPSTLEMLHTLEDMLSLFTTLHPEAAVLPTMSMGDQYWVWGLSLP